MEAWKLRYDWLFVDEQFMKILNFVVQNMVNNVDYFFSDCYSKAFGYFLQKSDQPILLLYKSQKLFYHTLSKQFIMNKNSL